MKLEQRSPSMAPVPANVPSKSGSPTKGATRVDATIALAIKYSDLVQVVAGTTLGMLIADVPAVILGKVASPKFPFKLVRIVSAAIFALLGIAVLFGFKMGGL